MSTGAVVTTSPKHGFLAKWPGFCQQHIFIYLDPPLREHTRIRCVKDNRTGWLLPQDPLLICLGKRGVDLPCEHLAGSHLDVSVAKGIGRAARGALSQILLVLAPCATMLSKSSCQFDGHRILRPRKCHWSQSSQRRDLKPDVTLSFVSQCNQNIDDKKS